MIGFLSVLGALLVLSVIVFVHELGHYSVARLLRIKVEEFAIGFGPKLVSFVRKGIRYSVRAFPLGGFCAFKGEDKDMPTDPDSFNLQKPYKRFLTILAGPVLNIIVAFLLATATLMIYGDYQTMVKSVIPDTPAAQTAVKPGDILVEVNGQRLLFSTQATERIRASKPETINFVVRREGKEISFTAHDIYSEKMERNFLGVELDYTTRRTFTFGEALNSSFGLLAYIVRETVNFFAGIFTVKNIGDQVMGPVGTVGLIAQAVQTSFEAVLRFAMLISINLGLFNLFPFPGLDGARLVFIGYEKIAGKPIAREREGMIHFAGFALLIVLIVLVTFKDIGRLFTGMGG